MTHYALTMRESEQGVFVECPVLPEFHAAAESFAALEQEAVDAIETVFDMYVDENRRIPDPEPVAVGEYPLVLPALTAAKLALWNAMCDQGLSKADLARRMGIQLQLVHRMVDFIHSSKIEQVERALLSLGKRLTVDVQDAA
jgi:antitoxin HicB